MDNIRLAQFIHLLMKNKEVRQLVDTITSSAVLILGCFTEGETGCKRFAQ